MRNETKSIIEFKNGGARLTGNPDLKLLNGFVFEVAKIYGEDKFVEMLNNTTEFEDGKYEVTAFFEDGETTIDFQPPLDKKHYIGVCNIVLQYQGV